MKKKTIALLLACCLTIGVAAGGTLAWLTATSDTVTNTFTTSDINVTLTETKTDFKMIPGHTIDKDPKATVTANSEDCYLFVKVEKSTNFDSYMTYEIASSWTAGTGTDGNGVPAGVYYREVTKSTSDQDFAILGEGSYTHSNVKYTWAQNQVLTKPEVTKADMTTAETTKPTLTFTAYASQLYKNSNATDNKFTPAQAWANIG